jgi:hypothetical protein
MVLQAWMGVFVYHCKKGDSFCYKGEKEKEEQQEEQEES